MLNEDVYCLNVERNLFSISYGMSKIRLIYSTCTLIIYSQNVNFLINSNLNVAFQNSCEIVSLSNESLYFSKSKPIFLPIITVTYVSKLTRDRSLANKCESN